MRMSAAFSIETSNPETSCLTQRANHISPISNWHGSSKQRVPSRAPWKLWAHQVTWHRNNLWETTRASAAPQISTDGSHCFTDAPLHIHTSLREQPLKR